MKKFILGFDIGGTKCAVNLADVDNGVNLTDKLGFRPKRRRASNKLYKTSYRTVEKSSSKTI